MTDTHLILSGAGEEGGRTKEKGAGWGSPLCFLLLCYCHSYVPPSCAASSVSALIIYIAGLYIERVSRELI